MGVFTDWPPIRVRVRVKVKVKVRS